MKSNLHAVQNTLKKKLKTAVDARKSRRKTVSDVDWESPDDDDDSDDAGLVLGEGRTTSSGFRSHMLIILSLSLSLVAGYEEVQPIMGTHYN